MNPHHILACIDAPDPDNFVLLIALARLFPESQLHVMLTGRPVRFHANKGHALWDYDRDSSLMAQQASAARLKNFLRHFGLDVTKVYDGGVAPRTLVPHWIHFADYYKFLDLDPLASLRHNELEPQEELVRLLLTMEMNTCAVVVGGPMTGLAQLISRCPEATTRFSQIHAMFGTWGEVELMDLGGAPRGAAQFNVACDPVAAYQVLMGLGCPIYLMPSEVTRVTDIGFENAVALREALPQNNATRQLFQLYAIWYDAAVRPRQMKNAAELIFIHDLVAAFSLHPELRRAIYDVVPVLITNVPHLASEANDWGKVLMKIQVGYSPPRYAARRLTPDGAVHYLKALRDIFE